MMAITVTVNYSSPSSQDPAGLSGFGGAGSIWQQNDTGLWWSRNSANTGWILIGSGDQTAFGLFSLSGGVSSGAVSGNSNIMTADGNTPFAAPPTITSRSSLMATMTDLYNVQQAVATLVMESVENALAGVATTGIRANMAFQWGQAAASAGSVGTPIALTAALSPFNYVNGTPVQTSELRVMAGPSNLTFYNNGTGDGFVLTANNNTGTSWISEYTFSSTVQNAGLEYFMIAIRSGS